jgi:hypothetical protein
LGVSLGVVAAGDGASSAGRANPPAGSGAGLKKIQKKLQKALDKDTTPSDFYDLVRQATTDKRKWIGKSFGSQMVAGCKAGWLLENFEAIDVSLEAAADSEVTGDDRKKEIDNALAAANAVAADVGTNHKNCPSPVQGEVNLAGAIFHAVDGLFSGEAPPLAERRQIAASKALFLGEDRIYGCAATQYLTALEGIDIPLAITSESSASGGRPTRLVKEAVGELKKFRRYWRKVPCDEPGTGTSTTTSTSTSTGTETQTTTSTTTTTTPALPACSDGQDNDGDGKVDGGDSGCLSTQDTTEQTDVWSYPYPGDGGMGFGWIDLKPFFGSWIGTVVAYQVFFGTTPVHTSMVIDHGPTPINGTKPCSSLGATGIRAGRGSAAPTGGGLPAAPDSDHMRIVIDTSDPPGGGDCGLGPVDLEVATDTRVP